MTFEEKIRKSLGGNGIYLTFDGVPWHNKDQALKADPRIDYEEPGFAEISRENAILLLEAALSNDLCYGVKRPGRGTAEQLATEFISNAREPAKFYTNSDAPYNQKDGTWSFSPITEATIDTGVVVREGNNLASLLWVLDFD